MIHYCFSMKIKSSLNLLELKRFIYSKTYVNLLSSRPPKWVLPYTDRKELQWSVFYWVFLYGYVFRWLLEGIQSQSVFSCNQYYLNLDSICLFVFVWWVFTSFDVKVLFIVDYLRSFYVSGKWRRQRSRPKETRFRTGS